MLGVSGLDFRGILAVLGIGAPWGNLEFHAQLRFRV